MLLTDISGARMHVPDNPRLSRAIEIGMVRIGSILKREATIVAPPNFAGLSDEDMLLVLQAASEVGQALEDLGFKVSY